MPYEKENTGYRIFLSHHPTSDSPDFDPHFWFQPSPARCHAGIACRWACCGLGIGRMHRRRSCVARSGLAATDRPRQHVARAVHGNRHGHPAGFSAPYRDELLALKGDADARNLPQHDDALLVYAWKLHTTVFLPISIQQAACNPSATIPAADAEFLPGISADAAACGSRCCLAGNGGEPQQPMHASRSGNNRLRR